MRKRKCQSCPIQDEPGEAVRFQYSMSLKRQLDSNTR
jgi:hypothetical protein